MTKRCIAIVAIAALSACGGGGGTSIVPASPASSPSSAPTSGPNALTFSIVIPSASTAPAKTRRPAYVSPNTGSIGITLESVNGVAQSAAPTVAAVGASASGCASSTSGVTCKLAVSAPSGDDLFAIATYQSNNGTGAVLASTAIAANPATSGSTVALDLGGVPASLSFSPAHLPLVDNETVQSIPVTLNVADASGATIVGSAPFQSPVSLQIQNDPAGALALSTSSVSAPGSVVTVTYNSLKALSDGSIVATDNGMSPATLVAAPLVINPDPVTILDDASSQAVALSEGGFNGTFSGTLANTADATLTMTAGTAGSGSSVATLVPKVNFDVTSLNVSDGSMTVAVPVQIVPDHGTYSAIGAQHTLGYPTNIIEASNGTIWTGDSSDGDLVAFNTSSGAYTTYNVDPSENGPNAIAFDANGNIWFADGPQIGEFNPSTQAVATYSTGLQASAWVTDIIAGPSGTMWFYDQGNSSANIYATVTGFGSIATASGTIAEYPTSNLAGPVNKALEATRASGLSMALASDGSIWFADTANYAIGHIDTSNGAVTETQLGAPAYPQQAPQELTIAPNGKVWFSSYGATSGTGAIGYLDPSSGNVTYYPVSANEGQATAMFADGYGNLWFVITPMLSPTIYSNQQLFGVINPSTGAVYIYPGAILPVSVCAVSVIDSSGTFWILDNGYGQIGKVTFK
jgi:streptogramin lyase